MTIPRPDPATTEPANGRPTPGADPDGYHLRHAEGDRLWFGNALLTFKAKAADTRGILSFCQVDCLRGWQAPVHSHDNEAELFWIVEGDVDILVGDQIRQATEGSTLWVPPHTAHSIFVQSDTCRMLTAVTPGGFEHFFEELGEPATIPSAPTHDVPLPSNDRLLEVGRKYGWNMLEPGPRTRDGAQS